MAGRTPRDAVQAFIEPLQRTLSCITRSTLLVSPRGREESSPEGPNHAIVLNKGEPVPLRGAERLQLEVQLEYAVVRTPDPERGPFKVSTRAYRYHILTADGTESFLYHWHPDGKSSYVRPHAHLGRALLLPSAVISHKQHVPTGRIALEHVVQLLLDGYDVVPLRDDASAVLEDTVQRFERWRTWS